MVRVKYQFCLFFIGLLAFAYAQNTGDTLVLVDNLAIRETHSIFFKNLQGKNSYTAVDGVRQCRSLSLMDRRMY